MESKLQNMVTGLLNTTAKASIVTAKDGGAAVALRGENAELDRVAGICADKAGVQVLRYRRGLPGHKYEAGRQAILTVRFE